MDKNAFLPVSLTQLSSKREKGWMSVTKSAIGVAPLTTRNTVMVKEKL
jgi:hypothetical protein